MNVNLKSVVKSDMMRFGVSLNLLSFLKLLVLHPEFKFIYTHRKCNYFTTKNKLLYYFNRALLYRLNLKYGFEISNRAQIGMGFKIDHRGSIIVNPNVIIGENVNISAGVLIGQENRGMRQGSPIIGNKVWIGHNASIVGKIVIGDNVLIAPGSYVNFDVPSNSVVFGNPGVIKASNNATEGYLSFLCDSKKILEEM